MPDLTEAPAPRAQTPFRPERKVAEEVPDRVLAPIPDLIEAPAQRVEIPAKPLKKAVEERPDRVLASLPELIEAPAPRVEIPARPERPFQERTPAPEQFEVPAPRAPVPVRPERKEVEETPRKAPAPVPAMVEPPAHPMRFPVKPASKPVEPRPNESSAAAATNKIEDTLLVSKSWYIQGGTTNKNEAIRISRVLKEFRWKVEPMYTIGVMLDDILSIESTKNQMNRKVIKGVEDAGYRLTAVTADQGKVVAWFKKKQPSNTP